MTPNPVMLQSIPLFGAMDDDERAALAAIMDELQYKAGQEIFSADQTGGTFYIIHAGQVELSITDDDGEKLVLELLESGDFFGELSLLDGGTRSATATAVQRTDTLVLDRAEFLELLLQRPHMAQDVMVALAKRIRRTDNLLRRRVSRNPNEAIEEQETLGDRVADGVARLSDKPEGRAGRQHAAPQDRADQGYARSYRDQARACAEHAGPRRPHVGRT